jgi:hypothetical protein
VYNDWEIISLLNVFNKKKNVIKVNYFSTFYNFINLFIKLIDYYCNFFLSFNIFINELFYNLGFIEGLNNRIFVKYKHWALMFLVKIVKLNNTYFSSFINNYYITDFYTKNSKTMSFSSLKQYKIFKL